MATCYYSIKSYKYYCLFRKIGQSRTRVEHVAFFVFFTLKGWKRLMIAEAPRQVINIVTLASALIPKWIRLSTGDMSDPLLFHITVNNRALGKTFTEQIMTGTMAFSVLVFAISFMLVCFAALLYFPLLCHIQGNLKEYCCHKVDKRYAHKSLVVYMFSSFEIELLDYSGSKLKNASSRMRKEHCIIINIVHNQHCPKWISILIQHITVAVIVLVLWPIPNHHPYPILLILIIIGNFHHHHLHLSLIHCINS